MAKKIIISAALFGLLAAALGATAQTLTQNQSAAAGGMVPLISLGVIDPSTIPEVNLQAGEKGPHVMKVQQALKSLKYLPADLEPTENFGPLTKQAIINFQKDNNLPAFGFWGPATRAALKNKLKEGGAVIDETVDGACMRAAVEKRENALLTTWDVYAGAIKAARETRKTELLAAWSIQDPKARHEAIKAAWTKFREGVKAAGNARKQSDKDTWTQFVQEAKNCKASAIETSDLEKVAEAEAE